MTFSYGGRCWDLDCLRDRFWLWWERRIGNRCNGRHAFDRDMDQLAREIDARPWPAPAEPEPEPEWTIEAALRSIQPHLYSPNYWRDAWADLALWMADWRAVSAAHRIECGLTA